MGINYFKDLNKERIEIKPINFWQALGLSFLFDIVLMFLNTPTDIFYTVLSIMEVNTYNDFWYIVSTVLSCIYQFGTLLIITVFINKRFNTSNEVINKFKIRKRDYLFASLLVVSYIFITYGWFDYILFSIPTGDMFESAMEYFESLPIVILLIETCIIAPIFEEVLYRGILLKGLINKYDSKIAIVYSALIFGIAHLNIPQGINAFLLGLILGTVFYYTRSIYLCMIMHFVNNLLVNFVYYPNSEIWTNILFIVVPIIGVILMILCFKILNLKERAEN
ncbi:CPBP family intramembrane glutamic endopeptidase [uncultured Clostridium sp.]|uniref:CPBP family intramembrane glutamic endopeptidase n=1 Tax=uncultured Clostridium sp. TaxID=59620 RepID=UPI0025DE605F|nr:CPBP family intramembrane glutamic endopeptidase [uncultured Clostridium sp.]MDU4882557.1 CPBP family intramembrane glutamic endopeptidase [Clostridium celatum]MDU7076690.1 CPBP family intramembrane glutamic endopeptidase [Clostridium celatum]